MADVNGNAKLFREMQAANALRQQMREGILNRFRQSAVGRTLGNAYDSEIAKGIVGGLRDAHRRVFEQGWYSKDVFDGRWNMDNRVGQENHTVESMGQQYDLRASFYGWDQANGTDKAKENQVEREDDLGR